MINEGIHNRLKDIYDEFDSHCRINNIDYSIDADYYNVQGYRLLDNNGITNTLRHMSNYVKDKWVDLEYDGFPVNYDNLKKSNFNVSTYNPLFKFTLKPIQEDDMSIQEDSLKNPTNAHGRRQSAFPSSFRKLKTRDTYNNGTTPKKKKKKKKKSKKKKKVSESLDQDLPFGDRLLSSIHENIGVSIIEPDILLTRNPAEQSEEDEEEFLEDSLKTESLALCKYLTILEHTNDESRVMIIEDLISSCTTKVNKLNELLGK